MENLNVLPFIFREYIFAKLLITFLVINVNTGVFLSYLMHCQPSFCKYNENKMQIDQYLSSNTKLANI